MSLLSKQEMFNRAYLGLRSQGFRRCMSTSDSDYGGCAYTRCEYTNKSVDPSQPEVIHCAWGWVDPTLPEGLRGSINTLLLFRPGDDGALGLPRYTPPETGVTAEFRAACQTKMLDEVSGANCSHEALGLQELVFFAGDLQSVHDNNDEPEDMEQALKNFAEKHKLTIPG